MIKTFKTAKIIVLIAISSTAPSTLASVQEQPSITPQAEATPQGLIIVKKLPPVQQSEVPVSITNSSPAEKVTDRRHPGFVRCKIEPVASSILKKRRVCMTNREWKLAIRLGNRYATEFVADNQPGFFVP